MNQLAVSYVGALNWESEGMVWILHISENSAINIV